MKRSCFRKAAEVPHIIAHTAMDRKVLRQRSVDEKAEKAKRRKLLFATLNKLIKVSTFIYA